MKVFRSIDKFVNEKIDSPVYIAIGTFDGVHIGHLELINNCLKEAAEISAYTLVVTFNPHPRSIINNKKVKSITILSEKLALFRKLNVDGCLIIPFNENISQMDAETFIREILIEKIRVNKIFAGFNFSFGQKGKGKVELLEKYSKKKEFHLFVLGKMEKNSHLISSTNIRLLISSGAMEEVEEFLGRSYTISGKIIRGNSIGRKIGYPTANLLVSRLNKLYPKKGVYACQILVMGEKYDGVVNIGMKPTVNNEDNLSIEVHIIDFTRNIYGKRVKLYLRKRLRDEIRFSSLKELSETIGKDVIRTRNYFRRQRSGRILK